jgi:alpha-L-fucosidase
MPKGEIGSHDASKKFGAPASLALVLKKTEQGGTNMNESLIRWPRHGGRIRRRTYTAILSAVLCVLWIAGCRQEAAKSPSADVRGGKRTLSKDERMEWWRDARFGMFIHWGLYAVPAGEWKGKQVPGIGEWIMERAHIPVSEYEQLAGQFNPVKFDADEWVRIAKNAGMKYIVITSKHHDGFCLWDSKVTNYDIVDATPFKRDVLRELSRACKKQGIRLCFYHSIMDWHHPDAQAPFYPNYNDTKQLNPNFSCYVENYMKPQLKELITNYGPLGVLWFDGEWIGDWTEPQGKDLYNYVRDLQPDILINNRVGKGRKGMEGLSKGDQEYAGDFGTPEQQIPAKGLPGVDWESCMTMNDTWGYKSSDHHWKSSEDLLRNLADIASKGGNFLLNVGPTSEGLIPGASVERLAAMGDWMKVSGESIYGTTASPLGEVPWGRCTAKPGKLYLHVFDWPAGGKLEVAGLKDQVRKAYLLADEKRAKLPVTRSGDGVVVTVPEKAPDRINTVVVLEIKS